MGSSCADYSVLTGRRLMETQRKSVVIATSLARPALTMGSWEMVNAVLIVICPIIHSDWQ